MAVIKGDTRSLDYSSYWKLKSKCDMKWPLRLYVQGQVQDIAG